MGGVAAYLVATSEDVTRNAHTLERAPVRRHREGREGPGRGGEAGGRRVVPLLGVLGGFDGEAAGHRLFAWVTPLHPIFFSLAFRDRGALGPCPSFKKKRLRLYLLVTHTARVAFIFTRRRAVVAIHGVAPTRPAKCV